MTKWPQPMTKWPQPSHQCPLAIEIRLQYTKHPVTSGLPSSVWMTTCTQGSRQGGGERGQLSRSQWRHGAQIRVLIALYVLDSGPIQINLSWARQKLSVALPVHDRLLLFPTELFYMCARNAQGKNTNAVRVFFQLLRTHLTSWDIAL